MSAIISPSRTLWTPSTERVARRVRKLLQEIVRPFWLNSDGKWLINDDGKFYVCDDCPCEQCECVNCTTNPPCSYMITLSGVESRGCCQVGVSASRSVAPKSWDGSYVVTQVGATQGGDRTCFRYDGSTGLTSDISNYNNTNCSGSPSSSTSTPIGIFLFLNATGIVLRVANLANTTGGGNAIFVGSVALSSPYDCHAPRTISNSFTAGCPGTSNTSGGFGGTADLVAL